MSDRSSNQVVISNGLPDKSAVMCSNSPLAKGEQKGVVDSSLGIEVHPSKSPFIEGNFAQSLTLSVIARSEATKQSYILLYGFVLLILIALFGARLNAETKKLNCLDCHTCAVPTPEEMCLKSCPSLAMPRTTSPHKISEAPDSMLLDKLVSIYQPVHFDHKLHAGMAEMGQDCATCHHYSPAGHIPPCRDCHGGEANPVNLRQPGLKGAYHRQCLGCHREWDHNTRCVMCHLPNNGTTIDARVSDSTDIIGVTHPIITTPDKKLYTTPYKPGPMVTFKHKEHNDLFGLRCFDCHKKENCGNCHAIEKTTKVAKTDVEIHAICNDCHKSDNCAKCHDTKERPLFAHVSTGWPLSRFHKSLDCRACHPTGKRIARLNNACASCHGGWTQANFKHAVTGLQLDETHREVDCTDCHTNKDFAAKPSCVNCHDDGRDYKEFPPGEFIGTK